MSTRRPSREHDRTKSFNPTAKGRVGTGITVDPESMNALRGCQGKRWYSTRSEAKSDMKKWQNLYGKRDPYRCLACGHWHLTSQVRS